MWVRSQDKLELIKCNSFMVREYGLNSEEVKIVNQDNIVLGIYKSHEKAVKVLDDIQNHVLGKMILPTYEYEKEFDWSTAPITKEVVHEEIIHLSKVYEMPND